MKKMVIVFCCLVLSLMAAQAFAGKGGGKTVCTTIQDGVITYSAGHYLFPQLIPTGYDPYGYNYQAHMFSGSYANVYLGGGGFPPYNGDTQAYLNALTPAQQTYLLDPTKGWYWPYRDIQLTMKWNDAWISNTDCDGDGKLDRHYGYIGYIGSGAWETNHMSDAYNDNGKECHWVDFVKIVAAPADATKSGGIWYTASGAEIGPDIWGEFATIQEVYNDPCGGYNGIFYGSPAGPGFGKY
ncbi:MAG: hypothetical protein HY879_10725 [Deltaproteobacteria bacterium]|nr:hypothetical protein [Deltaproteobacteria bacterium]